MDQVKKAALAAGVKAVMPAGWKYSLSVQHHSTIVCTISEAPVDILAALRGEDSRAVERGHDEVNKRFFEFQPVAAEVREPLLAILEALNVGNHDRSDLQTDYFDVGWYVRLKIGRWDKAFKCTAEVVE